MKVSEGGATTWILQQVIIALSIHGQEDIKGYSHTCLGRLTICAVQTGLVQKTQHSSSVSQ